MKKEWLFDLCLSLLVLLFTYTAASKLMAHQLFVQQMQVAPLHLMKSSAPVLGWIIPLLESLVPIGLLIDRFRVAALVLVSVLLFSFEVYITGMLLSGLRLPCTCGGIISKLSWGQHLVLNFIFILIALYCIVQIKKSGRQKNGLTGYKDLSRA